MNVLGPALIVLIMALVVVGLFAVAFGDRLVAAYTERIGIRLARYCSKCGLELVWTEEFEGGPRYSSRSGKGYVIYRMKKRCPSIAPGAYAWGHTFICGTTYKRPAPEPRQVSVER